MDNNNNSNKKRRSLTKKQNGLLSDDDNKQPWQLENRSHNSIENDRKQVKDGDGYFVENCIRMLPNWSLAVKLEIINNQQQKIDSLTNIDKKGVIIRLGGEGHQALLRPAPEIKSQWDKIETTSKDNYQQRRKSLGYLATPAVFERTTNKIAKCRPYPWEWKLAHTVNKNQHKGQLVSVATEKPLIISSRFRSNSNSIPTPQVFASPAGTVFYLEQPEMLFQDREDAPKKVKKWRSLGYGELLWLPYQGN